MVGIRPAQPGLNSVLYLVHQKTYHLPILVDQRLHQLQVCKTYKIEDVLMVKVNISCAHGAAPMITRNYEKMVEVFVKEFT